MLWCSRHLLVIAVTSLILGSVGAVDARTPPPRSAHVPPPTNSPSYSCRFDEIGPSIKCFRLGQPTSIVEFPLEGVKAELIRLLFSQETLPSGRISVQADDPALFLEQLEQFRKALDGVLPKVEEARMASNIDTHLYFVIMKTYGLGIARYRAYVGAKISDNKKYLCKFYEEPPAVACMLEGNTEKIFTFQIDVTR
jgi:hypothetical protein